MPLFCLTSGPMYGKWLIQQQRTGSGMASVNQVWDPLWNFFLKIKQKQTKNKKKPHEILVLGCAIVQAMRWLFETACLADTTILPDILCAIVTRKPLLSMCQPDSDWQLFQ